MKVMHITTAVSSSSACYRMHTALRQCDVDSYVICNEKQIDDDYVVQIRKGIMFKLAQKVANILLRIELKLCYPKRKNMPFSTGYNGNYKEIKKVINDFDVAHIHWINNGMMGIKDFRKIAKLGIPIVVTAHDNWFYTGGCHVRMGCPKYKNDCGSCPNLSSTWKKDLSYRILRRKKKYFSNVKFILTGPSAWMVDNLNNCCFSNGSKIELIPNPIDTNVFRKINEAKVLIEHKKLKILFGAVNADVSYKGMDYLLEALNILKNKQIDVSLVVFGNIDEKIRSQLENYDVDWVGYVSETERMVELYNLVDIYIVPSLEDSFNQTVAEAMACETPVVAFATGGIVDIIDHKINGYLSEYQNSDDLVRGVEWLLASDIRAIGRLARTKIQNKFAYEVVGRQLEKLYIAARE